MSLRRTQVPQRSVLSACSAVASSEVPSRFSLPERACLRRSFNIQLIEALTFLPKGIYEPLDTHIKARKYDMKALWPGLAEQYQYQGKQLVLWSQATVTMLHYNADLFRDNVLATPSDLAAQNT